MAAAEAAAATATTTSLLTPKTREQAEAALESGTAPYADLRMLGLHYAKHYSSLLKTQAALIRYTDALQDECDSRVEQCNEAVAERDALAEQRDEVVRKLAVAVQQFERTTEAVRSRDAEIASLTALLRNEFAVNVTLPSTAHVAAAADPTHAAAASMDQTADGGAAAATAPAAAAAAADQETPLPAANRKRRVIEDDTESEEGSDDGSDSDDTVDTVQWSGRGRPPAGYVNKNKLAVLALVKRMCCAAGAVRGCVTPQRVLQVCAAENIDAPTPRKLHDWMHGAGVPRTCRVAPKEGGGEDGDE
jgi:hypothetical protein